MSRASSRAEDVVVLGLALALAAWAWLAAPVGELPRSTHSWDVLQSGRAFADQGFLASRLQPRWAPPNQRAQFLVYTHYPPLPYWVAGGVEALVRDPLRRIDAMLRLVLCVGLGALLCGYRFLRNLGICVPAAGLARAALVGSASWWPLTSGELTWLSWLALFLFGGLAALSAAFARWQARRRRRLAAALACATGAAFSAFDAWPWFPTLLAAFALLAAWQRPERLRPLLLAAALAALTSLGAAATRLALNWWHFGSLEQVLLDVHEAFDARSVYTHPALQIAENRANYMELPQRAAASRLAWTRELGRTLPARLLAMYGPEADVARWAWAFALALALAS